MSSPKVSKPSSIVMPTDQGIKTEAQLQMPTWFIISILVVILVVLKKFIYIKDEKRHGK